MQNKEKIQCVALILDARQSANGLKYQIEQIQELLNDPQKFSKTMEWLNMVNHGLEKMRQELDKEIDWEALEGTEWHS